MGDIGFSVVGLGMGKVRAPEVVQAEGARLVSVVDMNAELAEQIAGEHGCKSATNLEEALADPAVDVVFILTPSGTHGDLSIQALEAGKHVITTKPMDVTLAKCDEMIAAQRKTGKLLSVDFEERYSETNQKLKFAMDHGLFGTPVLGEARLKWYRSQAYYDAGGGWRGTWNMDGGGSLANQSIHWIDVLQWVMGPVNRVWGRTRVMAHDIETEDIGQAMIEFASGAFGGILGTTTFPLDCFAGLQVHGAEGGYISTRPEPKWFFIEECADRKEQLQRTTEARNSVENMVSALRDGTPLLCDAEEGRKSIELLTAVYESARQDGKPVSL
jgi:UDP-N-acetyl-2-amino-2-deoxyglucuronate dehydrogenase